MSNKDLEATLLLTEAIEKEISNNLIHYAGGSPNAEGFKEHIQYRIGRGFKDLIVKKMDTINARLNGIRHVEKQCKMNKLGSYENSMKKNLDNLLNYEFRARALSAKVKPLQPFNLQQNKSCSHLLNKVRGYFESIDYNNEQHNPFCLAGRNLAKSSSCTFPY